VFSRDVMGVPDDPPPDGPRLGPFPDPPVWDVEVIGDALMFASLAFVLGGIVWVVETHYKDRP